MGIVAGVVFVVAVIFFTGWTLGIWRGDDNHAGPALKGPGGTMGPGGMMRPSQPPPSAFVAVSVATVWTTPQSPRPVDHPALTNPVDIRGWLSDMAPAQQQALTSDNLTQTQALFGDRVFVVGQQGDWDEVLVPGQPTPKNALGYPGWIPKAQLKTDAGYGALKDHASFALADRGITTWLYRDSELSDHDLEISTNTGLPVLNRTDTAVRVATPDRGPRWLDARTVAVYEKPTEIAHPTGIDLVRYAAVLLKVPYLWGGRAGFGFDCSGFTSTIYQVHGITIPRDADAQATDSQGRPVDKSALQPGDLLFYSHGSKDPAEPDAIYHVAMYSGNGEMIEALDSTTPVRITPVRLDSDYWGARRYLAQPP
ncbi:MAG: C40 family peptidase [Mycobacterium sp.]|nr:C40 family peptidase [Mycobacterium sp.]MBV9722808.1 C40 family peptidase [Mycobacterium sp.]